MHCIRASVVSTYQARLVTWLWWQQLFAGIVTYAPEPVLRAPYVEERFFQVHERRRFTVGGSRISTGYSWCPIQRHWGTMTLVTLEFNTSNVGKALEYILYLKGYNKHVMHHLLKVWCTKIECNEGCVRAIVFNDSCFKDHTCGALLRIKALVRGTTIHDWDKEILN